MDTAMFIVILLAVAVPAYFLGSINGALITSKLFYRKDIRECGSGNPGLTNFYRVFGKKALLPVLAIDIGKTLLPVIMGGVVFEHFFDMALLGRITTGLFVTLGHCFPVYYGFRGGKGILAIGIVLFVIDWRVALISWGVFIIITVLTRFVSLGSIFGAIVYPLSLVHLGLGGYWEIAVASLCAVLLVGRHHQNIKRLVQGVESKFSFKREKE
jgi:glycerol-3-phosphate acyltransferase PlsY